MSALTIIPTNTAIRQDLPTYAAHFTSMRAALTVALVAIVMVAVAGLYFYGPLKILTSISRSNTSSQGCSDPDSISSHIYNPYRLTIIKSCITASGTVDKVIQENDGDLHLRLRLDPAYTSLTNSANDQYQYGDLVVEIICVNPATQLDAEPSCQNYTNQITIPQEAQHITVTGPYVLDTEHNNWAEIHPVYTLKIDASTGTTVHITSETLNINYPDGSTDGWLGPSPRSHVEYVTVTGGEQFTDTLSLYSTSPNSEQITSITTTTPGFSIVSISPSTPVTFGPGDSLTITLTIQSPNSSYDGSIEVRIVTA